MNNAPLKSATRWMILFAFVGSMSACTTVDDKDGGLNLDNEAANTAAAQDPLSEQSNEPSGKQTSAAGKRGRGQSQSLQNDPLNDIVEQNDQANSPSTKSQSKQAGTSSKPSTNLAGSETTTGEVHGKAQSGSVQIRDLRFRGNQSGGTILVDTTAPSQYSIRKNAGHNQVVIELPNAVLPAKLARPYITKDFSSSITSFQAYQNPGSSVVRIVVQLKNPNGLFVQQEGNSLMAIPTGQEFPQSGPKARVAAKSEFDDNEALGGNTSPDAGAPDSVSVSTSNGTSVTTEDPAHPQANGQSRALSNDLADFMSGNLKFYGHPMSMEYSNAEIRDVLNQIADESGLNMVIADTVKGTVSIRLRQVPWDQALVLVLQSKALGYVRQGRVLRIAPLEQIQKEAEATQAALNSQKQLAPLRTRVVRLSHSKPDDLLKMVQTFLTEKRGKASPDSRTNSIIITDTDDVLAKVTELLLRLDKPTPQVMIEGKVVESEENITSDVGVSWLSKSSGINLGYVTDAPGPMSNSSGISFPGPNISAGFIAQADILGDLTAKLGLMESTSRVKILSSPRIVTLSGQKAEIATDFQFATFPSQTTPSATGAPTVAVVPTYVTVKIIDLIVTPLISADGRIRLDLDITREFYGDVDKMGFGTRPIYRRKAQSSLVVKNGQTAVLGGAYNSDETYGDDHLPILGNIPIIGNLFKHKTTSANKAQLTIFLTPTLTE